LMRSSIIKLPQGSPKLIVPSRREVRVNKSLSGVPTFLLLHCTLLQTLL